MEKIFTLTVLFSTFNHSIALGAEEKSSVLDGIRTRVLHWLSSYSTQERLIVVFWVWVGQNHLSQETSSWCQTDAIHWYHRSRTAALQSLNRILFAWIFGLGAYVVRSKVMPRSRQSFQRSFLTILLRLIWRSILKMTCVFGDPWRKLDQTSSNRD